MTHVTHSEEETRAVARDLAARLRPGAVLLLSGDLGAGKTAFVKGLAEGLGIDPDDVSSPTFTLLHEYGGGRLVLYHADLYRLDAAEAEDIGLQDAGVSSGVLAIEWAERLSRPWRGALAVAIGAADDGSRRIDIADVSPPGGREGVGAGHSIR